MMKQIINATLILMVLISLNSCKSRSHKDKSGGEVKDANGQTKLDEVVADGSAAAPKNYTFDNMTYRPLDLIGKSYNLPANPSEARKKLLDFRTQFLKANYFTQITPSEDKLYQVYYDYQSSGFKVLIGYAAGSTSKIPDGFIKMSTPSGKFGVFQIANDADTSYYQAWGNTEAAKEFRSYQSDIEVFNYDRASSTAHITEIRLHLK